jgi:hypothetical protein
MKLSLHHPILLAVLAWQRAHPREACVMAAIMAVLIGPFLLKPTDTTAPRRWDRRDTASGAHP